MSSLPGSADGVKTAPEPRVDTSRKPVLAAAVGGPLCAAVLESHTETRTLLAEILRDAGFVVDVATHPEALPAWWHGDVIVTDSFVASYRTDAVESVVRKLRARHRAPVVFVSAHVGARADAAAIGADAVVIKPFDIDELVATIRRVIATGATPNA